MKKIVAVILLGVLMCMYCTPAFALSTTEKAKVLYDLGLLKGTTSSFSEEGLELDRNASRAEICVTIVRMLGKEKKANYQKNGHPFNDVPSWAGSYVGWLYENYLVNGKEDVYFGAQDVATVKQFSAMLLRVLGFDDSKRDFLYDDSVNFAKNYGLLDSEIASHYELSRRDMIKMCYNALRAKIKNSNRTLIRKLCDERAVEKNKATNLGILKETDISDSFPDVPSTLGNISIKTEGDAFKIVLEKAAEHYGLRVFVREDGGVLTEIPLTSAGNTMYMKKGKKSYPGGSAAGYVNELYVYGLNTSKKYSFIVLKTTSEDELYRATAKSGLAKN